MKLFSKTFVAVLFSLVACQKKAAENVEKAGLPDFTLQAVKQDVPFEFTVPVTGADSYSISGNPTWLTLDSKTGVISGTALDEGNFSFVISSGGTRFSAKLPVVGDPLAKFAWHLRNSGQTAFSGTAGTSGEDMRAFEAHRVGAFGEGVSLMVSDDGMETSHPDLKPNLSSGKSKNYLSDAPYLGDPGPGMHGTGVAGIAAAAGWNGLGSRGVAPKVELSASNFLENQSVETTIDQASNDDKKGFTYDIFNQSWGYDVGYLLSIDAIYLKQLIYGATRHRDGKGSIYVRAAGNQGQYSVFTTDKNMYKYGQPLSSNSHEFNTVPWVIVVGAVNAEGKRSSYSSAGANLWVSAPGGEYGAKKADSKNLAANRPAMITTDLTGCDAGISAISSSNELNNCRASNSMNPDGNYVATFNGTSSAAPVVSGVAALILGVNPRLGMREVKHILATTSDQVDAALPPTTVMVPSGQGAAKVAVTLQDGWVTNASGRAFSDSYGFGRVNAKKAIDAAKVQDTLPPLRMTVAPSGNCVETSFCGDDQWLSKILNPPLVIPNNNSEGVTDSIEVTENLEIEAVQIRISLEAKFDGDIQIELTSPAGTKSIVLSGQNGLVDEDFLDAVLLSNAFYGERSLGKWTIRVLDLANSQLIDSTSDKAFNFQGTTDGKLTKWEINILGH